MEPISSLICVLSWYTIYHIKAYIPLFNVALPHGAAFLCAKSHIQVSLRCQQSQFLVTKAAMNIYRHICVFVGFSLCAVRLYRQIYVFICHIWEIKQI